MHLLESFDPGEVLTIEIPPGPSLSFDSPVFTARVLGFDGTRHTSGLHA